jgi:cyclic beta-1,2-glucan synthetase
MNSSSVGLDALSTHDTVDVVDLFWDPQGDEPIRGEILGPEGLANLARRLAAACELAPRRRSGSPLLKRFFDNKRVLLAMPSRLAAQGALRTLRSSDVEWLSDNFHIIDDALREVQLDLPPGYDEQLPKLAVAHLAGYPRVYALALLLVARSDSALDETQITNFVAAFQEAAPLSIGELWVLPTLLRFVLLENLRRLAEKMVWAWEERQRAEQWARDLLSDANELSRAGDGGDRVIKLPEELSDPFIVRSLQLMRDQSPENAALARIESELAAHGAETNEVLRREQRRQAASQVTVGNCVLGLRLLAAIDWNSFFTQSSHVEAVLGTDPAGAYPRQDFATSDRYRHEIERIARGSNVDELDVAQAAISLAQAGQRAQRAAQDHVGYYLIDRGAAELKAAFRYRPPWRERAREWLLDHPELGYFGLIGLAIVLLLALLLVAGLGSRVCSSWALLAAVLALLPLSELAVGLVNHLLTLVLRPRVMPKLEFKEGIPEEHSTFIVIPALLTGPTSAEGLALRAERHYLANAVANIRIGILTDFADAPCETMPNDQALLRDALRRIEELNQRHARGGAEIFFLFHRRRLWNEAERCWMGWERKRGKLLEFNRLLRGARDTSYDVVSARPTGLARVRYVITLDADTQMPPDTVGRLIGAIAHPLNRPRFDAAQGRVIAGYGVLQPRISFHLTAATHSRFAALLATSGGIDPYSTATSDLFMDLFGLGSFTGKGIYDVDAFEAATGETFPENQILSHDLIEGNYARCGLLNDTELFDDFPARYHAYARREERWVRGDWQLLPWLFNRVPSHSTWRVNPLPVLERWKLFDNLRRSLVPAALVLLLILGWTMLPGSPWFWTAVAVAVAGVPLLQTIFTGFSHAARGGLLTGMRAMRGILAPVAGQIVLDFTFLGYRAGLLCNAIARACTRLALTRRNLLDWETAHSTERRLRDGLLDFFVRMWPGPALAVATAIWVAAQNPRALPAALFFLVAWLVSPAVAWWVSRPSRPTDVPLDESERRALRLLARRTWHFFETFVGDEDHWLPPDNFQELPEGRVAHRTSPTNAGMLLLSTLAAHDLGYISLGFLVERLERTFDSFDRMEKHWGHFLNWYDTRTLSPLVPRYVSTVDSGNLLGCLLVLREALLEKVNEPRETAAVIAGFADIVALVSEECGEDCREISAILDAPPQKLADWTLWLEQLQAASLGLQSRIAPESKKSGSADRGEPWIDRMLELVAARRAEQAELRSLGDERGACAGDLAERIRRLAERIDQLAAGMDFKPLYRADRQLFSIGINLEKGRLDSACYDLLASEACLTSFLAVARSDAPRRHWFQLGRHFIKVEGRLGLISWGGSMFEYLMPRLVLRSLPGTLLAEAVRTAVARQIAYGRRLGIPWGVSESSFGARSPQGDYHYQSFGVPGLGLKQGLEDDHVVAPYATVIAAMALPHDALQNLRRLASAGAEGTYGMYEAVDYTRSRLARGQGSVVVKSYMAHHQGMSLVALTNVLKNDVMPRRFRAVPSIGAMELLLQEQLPSDPPIVESTVTKPPSTAEHVVSSEAPLSRRMSTPVTGSPRTHLLSNSQYHVMITNAGSGYSAYQGVDVTRWREDATREAWGQFCYVRDVRRGLVWSAGYQPVCRMPERYEVVFAEDKVSIRRHDANIETLLEVIVSSEQPAEIRRVTLTNHDSQVRELELTSYGEIVLAPHRDDLAHPAFEKLFLETEWESGASALLCRRRVRYADDTPVWAVHSLAIDTGSLRGTAAARIQHETDRQRFLGRGRTAARPAAMDAGTILSGTTGPVLDPIFSLRARVRIEPGGTAVVAFLTAVAASRSAAVGLADQYRRAAAVERSFELAWAHSQAAHRDGRLAPEDLPVFQRLASHILFAGPALRADRSTIAANHLDQAALWRFGISGDLPIVLAQVSAGDPLRMVRDLLAAHADLRLKGLQFDLVLVAAEETGYFEELGRQLRDLVRETGYSERAGHAAGVFVLAGGRLEEADRVLLHAVARAVFFGDRGSLADQLERVERPTSYPAPLEVRPGAAERYDGQPVGLPPDLLFPNGIGGFAPDGREYCLLVPSETVTHGDRDGQPMHESDVHPRLTPAPWINVVANPQFGFVVSESGAGFTWSQNSQLNRLTPWSNDPVSDPAGEVIYLRDEESGEFWCPTPLPVVSAGPTRVRHGQGYSVFERNTHGLSQELTLVVPPEDPVKLYRLRLRNDSDRARRISVTFYAEWVLGQTRDESAMHVVTQIDRDTGAVMARNAYRADFADRVAFVDVDRRPRAFTTDRLEFLGRHGSVADPLALYRAALSGTVAAALDACAAVQVACDLEPGERTEIVFLLGEADGIQPARDLIRRSLAAGSATLALEHATARWDKLLQVVQVHTPDRALDLLVNRWLLYQVQSCRLWGRSACYQSGGAYGFRDQLQDVMSLVWAAPEVTRSHILRAAARQFREGDVQHWWHPPSGRGIRSRIADDPLWLPFATAHYVAVTGDSSILEEPVAYLAGPALEPGQAEDYGLPAASACSSSLYDHCVLALDHLDRLGTHGLPLMDHGDWNDGMNRVGSGGKGESVWLAWFSICCLTRFAELALARAEPERAGRLNERAQTLRAAIESQAWDGRWYRRAYFDDGTPLGSAQNEACSIDSIAQSWAVFAGAGDPLHARSAMQAVMECLVRDAERLIVLFDPPFDADRLEPGYIKGYLPGVRENGGQYTHAAVWCVGAFAQLRDGRRAYNLLSMVNPIRLSQDRAGVDRYRIEPYALASDVYSRPPHAGTGGWSWYTGSASWLYRVILESILGLKRQGERLTIDPCIPPDWAGFEMTYRYRSATYTIRVENPERLESGAVCIELDNQTLSEPAFTLADDGQHHHVRVVMIGTARNHR